MRADQGLTLIELLIVIVILGILSAIIVFSVEGITNRGEAASCEASAQTVRIAAQAFYAQGQGPDQAARYPNDLQELVDDDFVDSLPGTLSADGLTLTFATGTFFVYSPTTGSVDSTGCGTVGSGGSGGGTNTIAFVNLSTDANGIDVNGGNGTLNGNDLVTATFSGTGGTGCAAIASVTLTKQTGTNTSWNMAEVSDCVWTITLNNGNGGGGWPGGSANVSFLISAAGPTLAPNPTTANDTVGTN